MKYVGPSYCIHLFSGSGRFSQITSHMVAHGYFDLIDHKFLVSGHTFLPSDHDFSLIEKKKKEKEIYVPLQWYSLVDEARTKARPFHAIRMQRQSFMHFKRYAI